MFVGVNKALNNEMKKKRKKQNRGVQRPLWLARARGSPGWQGEPEEPQGGGSSSSSNVGESGQSWEWKRKWTWEWKDWA